MSTETFITIKFHVKVRKDNIHIYLTSVVEDNKSLTGRSLMADICLMIRADNGIDRK